MTVAATLSPLLGRLRAWGWPGAVGALSLALAGVLALAVLPRQQQQLVAVEASVRDWRAQAWRAGQPQSQQETAVLATPWQTFIDGFPAADDGPARVASLWALAQMQGLAPVRSEFATEAVEGLPLQRLRLALPVSGPYPAVRRFIAEALEADASLSLDGLRIERAGPQEAVVQAQLQWSFWMRQP